MFVATLLATASVLQEAEEAPPPLIDIDGTVVIQFVLFLIMLAVLSRLLFRPYLQLRDERSRSIEGARTEAHGMDDRVAKIIADYDTRLGKAKLRGSEERARLRAEGAAHERQVLGVARDESHRAVDQARKKIASEATVARAQLDAQAGVLAKQMARKILGREVG